MTWNNLSRIIPVQITSDFEIRPGNLMCECAFRHTKFNKMELTGTTYFSAIQGANFFNKNSAIVVTLGVTKISTIIVINLVTLLSATKVLPSWLVPLEICGNIMK
jgi:hypothetical protein